MTLTGENPFQATETSATFKPGAEPKFLYKAPKETYWLKLNIFLKAMYQV